MIMPIYEISSNLSLQKTVTLIKGSYSSKNNFSKKIYYVYINCQLGNQMFGKYKQSAKNQNGSKDAIKKQRLSLPSIKMNYSEKNQDLTGKPQKIQFRQSSQKSLDSLKTSKQFLKPIIRTSIEKTHLNAQQRTQAPLKSYASAQQFQKISQNEPKLHPSKEIYISPTKKTKLQNLPNILYQGNFIKKNQQSVDTSKDEDERFKNQIFIDKKEIAEPQIWVIKKHKIGLSTNYQMEQLLSKKLNDKSSSQIQKPRILMQRVSSLADDTLIPPTTTTIMQNSYDRTLSTDYTEQKHIKQKLVGPQAVSKFYSRYKNIQKVKQMQEMRNQINPLTIVLTILQSYNIPPKRMDIIKIKGNEAVLDLKQIGLGQSISIKAISDILGKLKYFETINLSHNNILFDRVDIIIPKLKGLRKINLSHNRIGRIGVDLLAKEVLTHLGDNCRDNDSDQDNNLLEDLDIEGNCLSDNTLHTFLIHAKSYQHLRILNLSKNFLGNNFAFKLKQFLINQHHLNELYLHWNDITSKGMKLIFQGLTLNLNLKVLDLSWNQIGFQSIPAVCNFFKKNKSLLHLDISNCGIIYEDSKEIAQCLKTNHSIFGIHYEGNQGTIDGMGFLNPQRENQGHFQFSIRNQILERIKGVQKKSILNDRYGFRQNKSIKTCWICDSWYQKVISVSKLAEIDKACFIHFDFQKYKGTPMAQVESKYQIRKMLPLKQIKFFITKVSKSKEFKHEVFTPIKYEDSFQIEKYLTPIKIGRFRIQKKQFQNVQFSEMNLIRIQEAQTQQLFDQDYSYQGKCLPRTDNLSVDKGLFQQNMTVQISPQKKKKKKKLRNTQNDKKVRQLQPVDNYFKQGPNDASKDKVLIQKCAQFDIQHSKARKLIMSPDSLSRITQVLEDNYTLFRNVYYYLSNNNVNGHNNIFFISQTKFDQFLDFVKFQTKSLTNAKIRLKLITTLSINDEFSKNKQANSDIEERLFSRPQFFQFLLRIAIQKYCRKKPKHQEQEQGITHEQAFQKIIQQLERFQNSLKLPEHWRTQHLYNYDISLAIKSYEHFIAGIYNHYNGFFQKNLNTRMQKKMQLNEFKQIFLDANMRKTRQALKDAETAFMQSKQMQIQEGVKQQGLKFNQFLEALIRMAYMNEIKPIGTEEHRVWERIQQMKNHHEIKHSQITEFQIPLFLKLEALLQKIYDENRSLCHSRKMDRVFKKGIFSDEIQMLVQILKQRIDQYHEKYKPVPQTKVIKKAKLNTLGIIQGEQIKHHEERVNHKINLEYLVQKLRQKYKRIAEQMDRRHNELEQIALGQD